MDFLYGKHPIVNLSTKRIDLEAELMKSRRQIILCEDLLACWAFEQSINGDGFLIVRSNDSRIVQLAQKVRYSSIVWRHKGAAGGRGAAVEEQLNFMSGYDGIE